jgi:hypothetical protein
MFAQIRSLGKSDVTNFASIWSFIGVNPEVIKEIVPFPEVLVALSMITFQYLDLSLRLWVCKAENLVLFCVRHVLLDLN